MTRTGAMVSGWWDRWIVDGLVNATGWVTRAGSAVLRTVQTGLWQNYALWFVLGLFLIFVWYIYPAITTTVKGMIGK